MENNVINNMIMANAVRELCGGISDMTLWRWLHDPALGFPKPIYIGKRRYFREAEIYAWIEAQAEALHGSGSTDAHNSRMWQKFTKATDDFARHIVLVEWQDRAENPRFVAWSEGPNGLKDRVNRGVPGYENLIRGRFHE